MALWSCNFFWALVVTTAATGIFYLRCIANSKVWIGFFHPFSDAGGGGERVLWLLVQKLLQSKEHAGKIVAIYTADTKTKDECIIKGIRDNFGIRLPEQSFTNDLATDHTQLKFVRLRSWSLLCPWSFACLLMQNIGGIVVALEAILRAKPEIFVDTCGFAFTLPTVRYMANSRTFAYVHYPTVSDAMISTVAERSVRFNNASAFVKSGFLCTLKLAYYKLFLRMYKWALKQANTLVANSSWTRDHLERKSGPSLPRIAVVYPPTDITTIQELEEGHRDNTIISCAQFRPEKNHHLQLDAAKILFKKYKTDLHPDSKLCICGSARTEEQFALLNKLKQRVISDGLDSYVEFHVNVPYPKLLGMMKRAKVAVHTMVDEHFGISLVEFLAAGLVVVSHNSGGPLFDILRPLSTEEVEMEQNSRYPNLRQVGYLANTAEEFARDICEGLLGYGKNPRTQQMLLNAKIALRRLNTNEQFAVQCLQSFHILD